jgi:hypothetical protein
MPIVFGLTRFDIFCGIFGHIFFAFIFFFRKMILGSSQCRVRERTAE